MFELITSESINGLTNSELKKELKKVTTAIGTIGKKTKEIEPSMTVKELREVVNAYKYDGKEEAERQKRQKRQNWFHIS